MPKQTGGLGEELGQPAALGLYHRRQVQHLERLGMENRVVVLCRRLKVKHLLDQEVKRRVRHLPRRCLAGHQDDNGHLRRKVKAAQLGGTHAHQRGAISSCTNPASATSPHWQARSPAS